MKTRTTDCRDCKHIAVERHISPAVYQCRAVLGTLCCVQCHAWRQISEWRHSGNLPAPSSGSICCPCCGKVQQIPSAIDWRSGCCGEEVRGISLPIVPFRGAVECRSFAPVLPRPSATPDRPVRTVPVPVPPRVPVQKALFE